MPSDYNSEESHRIMLRKFSTTKARIDQLQGRVEALEVQVTTLLAALGAATEDEPRPKKERRR